MDVAVGVWDRMDPKCRDFSLKSYYYYCCCNSIDVADSIGVLVSLVNH